MKNKKPIIIYAYVCGDIIHWGHIRHFKKSKKYGDFLVVGVLTKSAIMEKKSEPILSLKERIKIIQSIKYVDLVVTQNTYSPIHNIKKITPDILMESTSHTDKAIKESRKIMKSIGGKVIVLSYYPLQSSTDIKRKIRKKKEK